MRLAHDCSSDAPCSIRTSEKDWTIKRVRGTRSRSRKRETRAGRGTCSEFHIECLYIRSEAVRLPHPGSPRPQCNLLHKKYGPKSALKIMVSAAAAAPAASALAQCRGTLAIATLPPAHVRENEVKILSQMADRRGTRANCLERPRLRVTGKSCLLLFSKML